MKQKKLVLTMAAVLSGMVAGGVLEHVRVAAKVSAQPEPVAGEAKVAAPAPVEKRDLMSLQSANDALRAANEELRRRLAEAERALADDGVGISEAAATNSPGEAVDEERRPRREGFAERMERMRQENPEAYAEMQRRRDEFRQQMEQFARDRNDFLTAVDVKNMNEAQRENHEKLMETVAHVNSLMGEMETAEGERRRELWREMSEAGMALDTLYAEERRYLLEETARSIGYQGNDASAFADHMQTIIENTSLMPNFGRGRGGGTGRPR
ncbi:MAG: hypothetical protein PHU80_05135 [Kiritimatiellae bacterium]|nr:hypothetical protein [Kiritimatiellia bacterium]